MLRGDVEQKPGDLFCLCRRNAGTRGAGNGGSVGRGPRVLGVAFLSWKHSRKATFGNLPGARCHPSPRASPPFPITGR